MSQRRKASKAYRAPAEDTPLLAGDSHGHGHSHGGDSHGHSHGGDSHGHSHGNGHGHSHGGDAHVEVDVSKGVGRGADCDEIGHREEGTGAKVNANRDREKASLAIGITICVIFMILEIVGGYFAHSLAIMTDAAHLMTDVGALSLSYFAVHIAEQSSNNQYTFGWHRAEIIGALTSIFSIWFLTGIILFEGVRRMFLFYECASMGLELANANPTCEGVDGKLMTVIGVLGLLVNLTLAVVLYWGGAKVQHHHSHGEGGCPSQGGGGHGHDHGHSHGGDDHGHSHGGDDEATAVNVQSAFLHALGDCINSVGVIIAALFVWYGSAGIPSKSSWYNMADPLASLFFGVITLFTTVELTKELLEVLMEGVPKGVDYLSIKRGLESIPNVLEVHDLHIWSLTTTKLSLSAHLEGDTAKHSEQILADAQLLCKNLRPKSITHTTFQIDPKGECCQARCFSDVH